MGFFAIRKGSDVGKKIKWPLRSNTPTKSSEETIRWAYKEGIAQINGAGYEQQETNDDGEKIDIWIETKNVNLDWQYRTRYDQA